MLKTLRSICKFIFFLLYIPICIISSLFINPKKEYLKDSKYYRWLLDGYTWFGLTLARVKIHASGLEKIPQDTRYVLVGNHYSNFDSLVEWHVLKDDKLAFISKKENFRIPFFGNIIRKCCFMAIDRENPQKALKTIYQASELLQSYEVSVGVYPEGTRNKSHKGLLPFHNAVFKIPQAAKAPIVIVGIAGTENIHKNAPWKKTDVYMEVLRVLDAETVQTMKTNELGDITQTELLAFAEKHGNA